jgi:hypothetical protein
MNAALRAVVRTGLNYGVETLGVRCGYKGLLEANFATLSARDVGGIVQQGGTILGSGRSDEFETPDGIQKAISLLEAHGIDGLIVIWRKWFTGGCCRARRPRISRRRYSFNYRQRSLRDGYIYRCRHRT